MHTPILKHGTRGPSTAFLKGIPYFTDLKGEVLEEVKGLLLRRSFHQGEVIFLEGEPCGGLFFIASGQVKIFKTSQEGKEQILHILGEGESFNDVAAFDNGPNPASAQALEPVVLYILPASSVPSLLARHPGLASSVIRVFAGRLRHLVSLVEDLSFRHVVGRLAKILLQHVAEAKVEKKPRLTQQQMAAMAGTAREVVGRALKALELKEAIRVERGRIIILDRERLERVI